MKSKTVEEIAVEAFVTKVFDSAMPYLKGLKDEISQFIDDGLNEYLQNYTKKILLSKTLLHRAESKNFNEIYQPLKLNYKDSVVPTESIEDVFSISNCITVMGSAGSGKSTLFKYLFLRAIKEMYVIPLFIELRSFNSGNSSIENYISSIVRKNHLSRNDVILQRLLKQGKFIFFFDGFDELASDVKERVVAELTQFVDQYNKNRFLLSSRPFANVDLLPMFHNMTICPFEKEDIIEFTRKQVEAEIANKIIESIEDAESNNLDHYLKNPLLLSLYILCFKSYPQVPTERSTFYRRVIDVLMTEHDSLSKLGYSRERRTKLSDSEYFAVLSRFCFVSYFEDRFSFDKEYISMLLQKMTNKNIIHKIDFNDFIYDLEVNLALWVDDDGEISFLHRSIQEYFTALFLKELSTSSKENAYKKVKSALYEKTNYEIDNLLSLCNEMDSEDCTRYLLMPIYDEVMQSIADPSEVKQLSKILCRLSKEFQVRTEGKNDKRLVLLRRDQCDLYPFVTDNYRPILSRGIRAFIDSFNSLDELKELLADNGRPFQVKKTKGYQAYVAIDENFVNRYFEKLIEIPEFATLMNINKVLLKKYEKMNEKLLKSERKTNELLEFI